MKLKMLRAVFTCAAATAVVLTTAASSPAAGITVTMPLQDAIAALPVQAEDRTGYERGKFRHWIDADKDSCNSRAEVLLAEAVVAPKSTGGCTLSGGEWLSYYDEQLVSGPRGLDIDHMVPLAESWDSGASNWTAERRQAYANDLGDARALVAVTARSNRSKSDQDPFEWMPPASSATCQYITEWTAVKLRWQLAVDPAEQAALEEHAASCPNTDITVELAD